MPNTHATSYTSKLTQHHQFLFAHYVISVTTRLTGTQSGGWIQVMPNGATEAFLASKVLEDECDENTQLCPWNQQHSLMLIIRNSTVRRELTQCAWKCSWRTSRPGLGAGGGRVRGSLGRTGWTPEGPGGPAGSHSTWTQPPEESHK